MVRPKECEIFNPENSKYKGYLQVVLSNEGKKPAVDDNRCTKAGKQPGQGVHRNAKKVMSKPMDLVTMQNAQLTSGFGNTNAEKSFSNTYKSNDHNQTLVNQIS